MKNTNLVAALPSQGAASRFSLKTAASLATAASVAVLLTACGGGGGGGGDNGGGGGGPTPILQVGMQRQYTGTTTRSVVYANPTGSQQNNTLIYNFNEDVNVLQAAANTGAQFDVRAIYSYSITQDPGTGNVPISQTIDTYENLLTNGSTQATSTVGELSTVLQNDETDNAALGTGPYTITSNSGYTYTTPIPGLTFPLQTGTQLQLPLAEIVITNYQDVNPSGAAPSNGGNVAYTSQENKNNDGSYTSQVNRIDGVTQNATVNSDGTASISSSGGTTVYTTTIGTPIVPLGTASTIPVTYTATAPAASSKSYTAADWYPGNAYAPTPLASESKVVVGPTTSLPSECGNALVQPDMFEVDTTETSLNPLTGSTLSSTTRAFNANGVVVCSLLTQVSSSYNILTGALNSTTTTNTTTILTSLN